MNKLSAILFAGALVAASAIDAAPQKSTKKQPARAASSAKGRGGSARAAATTRGRGGSARAASTGRGARAAGTARAGGRGAARSADGGRAGAAGVEAAAATTSTLTELEAIEASVERTRAYADNARKSVDGLGPMLSQQFLTEKDKEILQAAYDTADATADKIEEAADAADGFSGEASQAYTEAAALLATDPATDVSATNASIAKFQLSSVKEEQKARDAADQLDIDTAVFMEKARILITKAKTDKAADTADALVQIDKLKSDIAQAKNDRDALEQEAENQAEADRLAHIAGLQAERDAAKLKREGLDEAFFEKAEAEKDRLLAKAEGEHRGSIRDACLSMNKFLSYGEAEACVGEEPKWKLLDTSEAKEVSKKVPAGIYKMEGWCSDSDWNSQVFAVSSETKYTLDKSDTGRIDVGTGIKSDEYELKNGDAAIVNNTPGQEAAGKSGGAGCFASLYELKV